MSKFSNSRLHEINRIYQRLEELAGEDMISAFEAGKDPNIRQEIHKLLNKAINEFNQIMFHLGAQEVIDAYYNPKSTVLLRRNLSGLMSGKETFNEAYIPVMKQAIKDDVLDNTYHFLYALKRNLEVDDLTPMLSMAIKSKYQGVRRAGISIIGELNLVEFLPEIEALINDPDQGVAHNASLVALDLFNLLSDSA